jgi:hypothetical protein
MKKSIEILRSICRCLHEEEYIENLYKEVIDTNWWSDDKLTNDIERERFLYIMFVDYYDLIMNGEIREIEECEDKDTKRLLLINRCKIQLDKELSRVKSKKYIREE